MARCRIVEREISPVPPPMVAAARSLLSDAVAAEVATRFEEADISSILVRGASIARHLYRVDETRSYDDADLLVERDAAAKAGDVLRELGFRDVTGLGRRVSDRPAWSATWQRDRDRGNVDLHWTLVGANADSEVVWQALGAQVEPLEVARRAVNGLNAPATALVVAMHAAQHGLGIPRVREDLARGISLLPQDVWRLAKRLAEDIDALDAYAFGLRLLPEGQRLADDLRLPNRPSVETILRSEAAPPTALGFDWLSRTPGIAAKARLIVGKIFPDRAFMRVWFPPARRGGLPALALGYAWRPIWLVLHAPAGVRSWSAARGATRRQRPPTGV